VQPAAAGDDIRLAVRPSDLVVLRPGAVTDAVNRIEAVVNVVEYQGREFAVGVTTTGGQQLHVHADYAPTAGATVTLTLDPARALVYSRDLDSHSPLEQELAEVRS